MSKMPTAKYLLFKKGYGFANYNPDSGTVHFVLDLAAATEATKDDWSELSFFGVVECDFIPAPIYVDRLERQLAATLELCNS